MAHHCFVAISQKRIAHLVRSAFRSEGFDSRRTTAQRCSDIQHVLLSEFSIRSTLHGTPATLLRTNADSRLPDRVVVPTADGIAIYTCDILYRKNK